MKIGIATSVEAQVLSGLKEGDKIVVAEASQEQQSGQRGQQRNPLNPMGGGPRRVRHGDLPVRHGGRSTRAVPVRETAAAEHPDDAIGVEAQVRIARVHRAPPRAARGARVPT